MATLNHVRIYLSGTCENLLALHNKTAQVPAFPTEYVFFTSDSPPLMNDAMPYLIAGGGQTYRTESGGELASPKPDDYVYLTLPVLQFLTWEEKPRLVELLRKAFPKLSFNEQITALTIDVD
jgi:hypothetical protein